MYVHLSLIVRTLWENHDRACPDQKSLQTMEDRCRPGQEPQETLEDLCRPGQESLQLLPYRFINCCLWDLPNIRIAFAGTSTLTKPFFRMHPIC